MKKLIYLQFAILLLNGTDFCFGQSLPADSSILLNNIEFGFTDKTEAKNTMINGLKEGKWIEYSDSGSVATVDNYNLYFLVTYKEGKPIGLVRKYFSTGEIYFSGELDNIFDSRPKTGTCFWYRFGKIICQGTYLEEKRNGTFIWYDDEGNVKLREYYVNDELRE